MDPSNYLQNKSFSQCPSLPLVHFLSSLLFPSFHSSFLLPSIFSTPEPPSHFLLFFSNSPSPIFTITVLPPHPRFRFLVTPPPDFVLTLSCFTFSYLFTSLLLFFSASHSPSEAQKDVAEEGIPGLRRNQYCQSSATPRGPFELVSD